MTSEIYNVSKEIEFSLYEILAKYHSQLHNDYTSKSIQDKKHYSKEFNDEVESVNLIIKLVNHKEDKMYNYYSNLFKRMVKHYDKNFKI